MMRKGKTNTVPHGHRHERGKIAEDKAGKKRQGIGTAPVVIQNKQPNQNRALSCQLIGFTQGAKLA